MITTSKRRKDLKFEGVLVLAGDALERLAELDDNSIDAVVTDPPYELGFMGKQWDAAGIANNVEMWKQCLRVLKPGGHLLAFGGTRTYHRMACAIEDAGFEIRDSLHWTYGSGFPKSLNVAIAIDKQAGAMKHRGKRVSVAGNRNYGGEPDLPNASSVPEHKGITPEAQQWQGWGTALKPSHEPILVCRKPLAGTVAQNVLEWGTGALNIDGCRVGTDGAGRWPANTVLTHAAGCRATGETVSENWEASGVQSPASVALRGGAATHTPVEGAIGAATVPLFACVPGCPIAELDKQSGVSKSQGGRIGKKAQTNVSIVPAGKFEAGDPGFGDTGGASRFFTTTEWDPTLDCPPFLYVAKPSKRERNAGVSGGNTHPTLKPVALMRHLVRLVCPSGGVVLDPFLGSGTTAVAAILEGREVIGCEMTADYLPIIKGRIQHALDLSATA